MEAVAAIAGLFGYTGGSEWEGGVVALNQTAKADIQ